MDITYTIPILGVSNLLFNFETGIDPTYFLLELTDPSGNDTKYAVAAGSGCDYNWIVSIDGTRGIYESLLDAIIYFYEYGTWEVGVYYQSSDTNIDPENATFVTNISFQVV